MVLSGVTRAFHSFSRFWFLALLAYTLTWITRYSAIHLHTYPFIYSCVLGGSLKKITIQVLEHARRTSILETNWLSDPQICDDVKL